MGLMNLRGGKAVNILKLCLHNGFLYNRSKCYYQDNVFN